jgi:hypothetical protein
MAEATLDFLAQQQARILAELADARADMRTLRADMDWPRPAPGPCISLWGT